MGTQGVVPTVVGCGTHYVVNAIYIAGPPSLQTRSAPQFTDVLSRHSNLEYLLSLFNEVATRVLVGGRGSDEVTFKLFVSLLGIICRCSCYTHHLQLLQNDDHILKHSLGKHSRICQAS